MATIQLGSSRRISFLTSAFITFPQCRTGILPVLRALQREPFAFASLRSAWAGKMPALLCSNNSCLRLFQNARRHENFLQRQRFAAQILRRERVQFFQQLIRCCRRPEFPLPARFVSHSTRRANQVARAVAANRARILRKRSRAASASIVSSSQPCSMMVNSSINPSNSEIRCVETNTVRLPGSPD